MASAIRSESAALAAAFSAAASASDCLTSAATASSTAFLALLYCLVVASLSPSTALASAMASSTAFLESAVYSVPSVSFSSAASTFKIDESISLIRSNSFSLEQEYIPSSRNKENFDDSNIKKPLNVKKQVLRFHTMAF